MNGSRIQSSRTRDSSSTAIVAPTSQLGLGHYFVPMRWAAVAVTGAGVGKELIVRPSAWLALSGVAFAASLWLGISTKDPRSARITTLTAVILYGVCMALSRNGALIILAPLIPTVAVNFGLRVGGLVAGLTTFWAGVVASTSGSPSIEVAQVVFSVAGPCLFLLEFARLLRREREAARALALQTERVAAFAALIERHRFAEAVHDGAGHYLSAALVQLEAARVTRSLDPERADACVARARQLVTDGMNEVRRAVSALREQSAPTSLDSTLSELIVASNEAGIATTLSREGDERRLKPEAAWAIFSSLQEGLTNVRKHARAGRVDVRLRYLEGYVELTVHDDGAGTGDLRPGGGLGAIRERASALGGTASFTSTVGNGFALSLRIAA
jgi:signal transduction histidine kinase